MSDEEPLSNVDDDLEIIVEDGEELENFQNQEINLEETNENEQNHENAENETKQVVKPKRVVRNPQPKLNEQTLKGPKGLAAIEGYFERVKFKGRGYEELDLNVLMKTYEYWCHRLFPKFPFDDCIARLEKLGTKKATQTQIKRIRLDLNFDEDKPLLSDEDDITGFVDTNNDQFDELLPTTTTTATTTEPILEMTEEQLERMRQNKERAQQLREERLRKMREKAQEHVNESNKIIAQNNFETDMVTDSLVNSSQHIYDGSNDNELKSNQVTETTENFDADSTVVNSQPEIDKSTKLNETMTKFGNQHQDNEDILDIVEENTTIKKKKRVIESSSEDETIDETNTDKCVKNNRRNILESDDDLDNEIVITNTKGKNSVDANSSINDVGVVSENDHIHLQNNSPIIESENESDENDIENILSQINTDESYPAGFKNTQNMETTENKTSHLENNQPMDVTEETA